jgi:hypothetical protein
MLARVDLKLLVTPEALPCVMTKTAFAGSMRLQPAWASDIVILDTPRGELVEFHLLHMVCHFFL